jgi:hypothetical protein
MIISFFISRIVTIPVIISLLYGYWEDFSKTSASYVLIGVLGYPLISILNIFWFYKMVSGALKLLKPNKVSKGKE